MMNVGTKLKGVVFIAGLAALTVLLIGPSLQRVYDQYQAIERTDELIRRHQGSLSKPRPSNPYQSFEVFVHSIEAGNTSLEADVQTSIIDVLQNSQARLIDLRQEDDDTEIPGLVGIEFLLNYEGDLRSILNVLGAITEMGWPILVEDYSMRAQGPDERPGLRMLVTLRLKIWTRSI